MIPRSLDRGSRVNNPRAQIYLPRFSARASKSALQGISVTRIVGRSVMILKDSPQPKDSLIIFPLFAKSVELCKNVHWTDINRIFLHVVCTNLMMANQLEALKHFASVRCPPDR